MNWKGHGSKQLWTNFKQYSGNILRKTIKNLSQDSQSPSQDLNLGPPKYKAGMLTTQPWHSFKFTDYTILHKWISFYLSVYCRNTGDNRYDESYCLFYCDDHAVYFIVTNIYFNICYPHFYVLWQRLDSLIRWSLYKTDYDSSIYGNSDLREGCVLCLIHNFLVIPCLWTGNAWIQCPCILEKSIPSVHLVLTCLHTDNKQNNGP
jgi:hypothetical protein